MNAVPTFANFAEADAHVRKQIKLLGKGPYTSSAEYHALYPIIMQMRKDEGIQTRKRRKLKGVDLRPMWMRAQEQGII